MSDPLFDNINLDFEFLTREQAARQRSAPTAEDIFKFLPGIEDVVDREAFTAEYDKGIAALMNSDIDRMDGFFEAFGEEMFRQEQLLLAVDDLDLNPFTDDKTVEGETAARRRVVEARRALEMQGKEGETGVFTAQGGRGLGESINEMLVTPAITAFGGGLAGLFGGPAAPVTVPAGMAVGYKGGQALGAARLADRVYNQSMMEYQNNLMEENRRRYINGEDMISYDLEDSRLYAGRAVAVELMMELTTSRIPGLRTVPKGAKKTGKGVGGKAVTDFTDAELSAIRGGAKQHVRKFAANTLRQSGQEAFEEGFAGLANDSLAELQEFVSGDELNVQGRFDVGGYFQDALLGAVGGSAFGSLHYTQQAAASVGLRAAQRAALGPQARQARDTAAEIADIESGALEADASEFGALSEEAQQERVDQTREDAEAASQRAADAGQRASDLQAEAAKDDGPSMEEQQSKIDEAVAERDEAFADYNKLARRVRLYNEVFGKRVTDAGTQTVEEHLGKMSKAKTKSDEGDAASTPFSVRAKAAYTIAEKAAVALGDRLGVNVVFVDGGQNTENDSTTGWFAYQVEAKDSKPTVVLRSADAIGQIISEGGVKSEVGAMYLRGLVAHEAIHAVQFYNPELYRHIRSLMDDSRVLQAAQGYSKDLYQVEGLGNTRPVAPGTQALMALLHTANPDSSVFGEDAAAFVEAEGAARLIEEGARKFDGKVESLLARIGLLGGKAQHAQRVLRVLEAAAAKEGGLAAAEAPVGGSRATMLASMRFDQLLTGEAQRAREEQEREAREKAADALEEEMRDGVTPEDVDAALEEEGIDPDEATESDVAKARIAVAVDNNMRSDNLAEFYGATDEELRVTMYHGTRFPFAESDVFDPSLSELGLHLSANPIVANTFADSQLGTGDQRVYPLVARMENPLRLLDPMSWNETTVGVGVTYELGIPTAEAIVDMRRMEADAFTDVVTSKLDAMTRGVRMRRLADKTGMDLLFKISETLRNDGPEAAAEQIRKIANARQKVMTKQGRETPVFAKEVYNRRMQRYIQSLGYDSVVYVNRAEMENTIGGGTAGNDNLPAFPSIAVSDRLSQEDLREEIVSDAVWAEEAEKMGLRPEDSYIVFDANQVKSATGNNGSFSLNASIAKARISRPGPDVDSGSLTSTMLGDVPPERHGELLAAAQVAANLDLEEIRHTEWVGEMRKSPHANTLTIPTAAEFTEVDSEGNPRIRAFRITGTNVVYALKRVEQGQDEDNPTFDGYEWTGLANNETNARDVVPIVAGHAILMADGKPVRGDYFDVRKPGSLVGKLPALYRRVGFKITGRVEFDPQFLDPETFPAQLEAWKADGWNPEYNYDESNPEPEVVGGERVPSNLPAVEYAVLDGLSEAELSSIRSGGLRAWAAVAGQRSGSPVIRSRDASQQAEDGTRRVDEGRSEQRDVGDVSGRPADAVADGEGRGEPDQGTGRAADDTVRPSTDGEARPQRKRQGQVNLTKLAVLAQAEARNKDVAELARMMIGMDLLPDAEWYRLHKEWKDSGTKLESKSPEAAAFREYANAHARSVGLPGRNTKGSGPVAKEQRNLLQRALNYRSIAAAGRLKTLLGIDGSEVSEAQAADLRALYVEAIAQGIAAVSSNSELSDAEMWYGTTISNMVRVLNNRVPGLRRTDPNFQENRVVFTMILAIMSNGEKIDRNMAKAIEAFNTYVETGVLKAPAGYRVGADFVTIQQLREHFGSWTEVANWMKQRGTVGEVNARIRQLKKDMDEAGQDNDRLKEISGELVDQDGYNALVIGPKIGSFYLNMNENWNPITMDIWFTRTIARVGGITTRVQKRATSDFRFYRRLIRLRNHYGNSIDQDRQYIRERVSPKQRKTVDNIFGRIVEGRQTKRDMGKLEEYQKEHAVKSGAEANRDEWAISIHKYNPEFRDNENRASVLDKVSPQGEIAEDFNDTLEADHKAYRIAKFKEADPLKKVVLTVVNGYAKDREAEMDAPNTGGERAAMRVITTEAVARANEIVEEQTGKPGRITNAAAQANLWYLEKGIYFAMVQSPQYGDPRAQDFASAADKVTKDMGFFLEGDVDQGGSDPKIAKARVHPVLGDSKTAGEHKDFNDADGVEDEDAPIAEAVVAHGRISRPQLEGRLNQLSNKLSTDEAMLAEMYGIAPFMNDTLKNIVDEQKDLLGSRLGMSPALAADRGLTAGLAAAKAVALAERRMARQERQDAIRKKRDQLKASEAKRIAKLKEGFAEQKQKLRDQFKERLAKMTKAERTRKKAALQRALEGHIKALENQEKRYERRIKKMQNKNAEVAQLRSMLVDMVTTHLPSASRGKFIKRLTRKNLTAGQMSKISDEILRESAMVDLRGAKQRVKAARKKYGKSGRKMANETREAIDADLARAEQLLTTDLTEMDYESIRRLAGEVEALIGEANGKYDADRESFKDEKNPRSQGIMTRIEAVLDFLVDRPGKPRKGRAIGTRRAGELAGGLGRNGGLDLRAALSLIGLKGEHKLLTRAEDRKKLDARELIEVTNAVLREYGYRNLQDFVARTSGSKGLGRQEFVDFTYRDKEGDIQVVTLSLGQAMKLLAMDEHTMEQLRKQNRKDPTKVQEIAFTNVTQPVEGGESIFGFDLAADIETFREQMLDERPELHEIIMRLKDVRNKLLKPKAMAALFRLTGNTPPSTEDYEPRKIRMDSPAVKDEDQIAQMANAGTVGPRFAENAGMTIRRTGGGVTLVGDFMGDYMEHAENSLNLAHMAEPTRILWSVLSDREAGEAIARVYGDEYLSNLRIQIGYGTGLLQANMDAGPLGEIVAMAAGSAIALNDMTFFKVLFGGLNNMILSPDISVAQAITGITRAFELVATGRLNNFMEEKVYPNSGYMWDRDHASHVDRRVVFTREDGLANEKDLASFTDIMESTLTSMGGLMESLASGNLSETKTHLNDIRKAVSGISKAIPVLRVLDRVIQAAAVLSQADAASITKEDVLAGAEIMRDTQNTSSPLDDARATARLRVKGGLLSYLLTFSSDPLKTQSRMLEAETFGEVAKANMVAVVNNAAIGVMAQMMSMAVLAALLDDDDERDQALNELNKARIKNGWDQALVAELITRKFGVLGFLFSYPASAVYEAVSDNVMHGTRIDARYAEKLATESLTPIGVVPLLIGTIGDLTRAFGEPDDVKRAEAREDLLFRVLQYGLGLPLNRIQKYGDAFLTETNRAEVRSADYLMKKMNEEFSRSAQRGVDSANKEYQRAKKLRDRREKLRNR